MRERRVALFFLFLLGLLVLVGTSVDHPVVYASPDPVSTYYEYATMIVNGTALNSTDNIDADDEVYYAVDCDAGGGIYEVNVEHISGQVNESITDITQIFFEDNFKFNETVTAYLEWFNWTANAWVNINNGTVGSTKVAWNKTWASGFGDVINSTGYMKVKIYTLNQSNTHRLLEDYLHWDVTYVVPDTTPPEWSNAGTNNTVAGQPTLFHVKWTDVVGLSGFIFGTNNTGTWTNDTWTPMSGTTDWSNITKILNSAGGVVVQWRIWANDTSNNWNDTGILSLTTTQPPVASFTYSPLTPYTGENVTFNATDSYDPDGTIASYFWDFGDGTNGTGEITTHTYADNGTYTVTLTVTDNDGLSDTTSASITVLNRLPVAIFTESAETVSTSETITFNASASYDPDGSIVSYFWDFGDGTNTTGVIVNHAYADNGTYTVTLTVTDNDGATASTNATKSVLNRPPVASFTESATTVLTREAITFNASTSYDPDGSIVSYRWDFGDGNTTVMITPIITHAYADNGTYTVTLTVTDDDGETALTNATKTVLNRPPVASFTESTTTVYTGEPIYFNASASYDPDGSIVSYFWDFGDGTNASGVVVGHSYADDGNYTVTLTITDNDEASNSTSAIKTVLNRSPVASFTESAETVLTGETITFDGSNSSDPDGNIVSYFWDFGDGTNATGVTVGHGYADDGNYTVTLTVTDDDGATGIAAATKTILNRSPTASFTPSATVVYTGVVIHFDASGSSDPDGVIVSYFWDFGDGTNATGVIVDHAYADDGTYVVTLTVTDDDGATAVTTQTIKVLNRSPVASFTESAETVYTNEAITFNASGSYDPDGSIVSHFWDFGDGTNASGVTVDHAYTDNGTYIVTLTVTDDDGATDTATSTKTVLNRPPVANFTESAENVVVGEVIYFNASSSYDLDGYIVSYFWDFGDGINATGVTTEHAYADNGFYTVTLTVTDDDGATASINATKTVGITPPVAIFTESAETVYIGEVISFNASGSYDPDGYIVSYFWDFGDGSNATGVVVDHAYADNGNYTVTLTVTDDDGATGTATATKTVLNRLPVAIFTESATTVLTGEVIYFNASGSYDPDGNITSYFWDFGDGTNATGVAVEHAYADDGNYTVTLTVTDDDGATASVSTTKIVLNRLPVAVFTESAETVITDEVIYFNASGSYDTDGYIVSYFWDFGDGTNATGVTVEHSYVLEGTYIVTLTVTDDDEATASTTATKTVNQKPPVAIFTESATTVLTGEVIYFNASGSYDPDGNITSYFWDFGDGANATGVTVDHAYADDGTYVVILTVTDDDGATGTATSTKTVINRPPVASFSESATTVLTNVTITFNASQSYDLDGVINYFWDFGDGTNATGVVVDHAYLDDGNYTVTLTVTDDDGATDTATSTKTIINRPPVAGFTESAEIVLVGEDILFNAWMVSYDPDGIIVSYFWDFGDGTNASAVTILHAYEKAGNYTVTLFVIDDDGANDTATANKTAYYQYAHDITVTSVTYITTYNQTEVYEGEIVNITVVVGNEGNETETFNVTAYYDNNIIGTQTVTDLPFGENATLIFVWDTTGVQPSINYTIKAEASVVPGEIDTSDNTYVDGALLVKGIGDVNADGTVNIIDIVIVALAFESAPEDNPETPWNDTENWNPLADLNYDGIVNIIDLVIVALHWEETYP